MSKRHPFTIQIGDWSDDGHGKCETFYATAARPIDIVREAYFTAKKKHPDVCPESFCNDYEDSVVPAEVRDRIAALGGPKIGDDFDPEQMANVVAWFIGLGDPEIDARIEPRETVPTLAFYGNDKKRRHIGFIGYGLFS
jgi:hypothetical protein